MGGRFGGVEEFGDGFDGVGVLVVGDDRRRLGCWWGYVLRRVWEHRVPVRYDAESLVREHQASLGQSR